LRVARGRHRSRRLVQEDVREPLRRHRLAVDLDRVAARHERVELSRLAVDAHAAGLDQLVGTASRGDPRAREISVETHAVIVATRAALHLVDALDLAGPRRSSRLARARRGGRADDQRGRRQARRGVRDAGTVRRRRDLRGARRRGRRRDPHETPAVRRGTHGDAAGVHARGGRGDRQEAVNGYAFTSLDELGDGPGFRKVRAALGVTAFGVNGIVFPPGFEGFDHFHDTQDELYFVHRGRARVEVGGETREVGEGGLVHVESNVPRRASNASETAELVVLVVGGQAGYGQRDG